MTTSLHSALVGADLHISKFLTGTGTPFSVVTPGVIGQAYTDLNTGITYVANGVTNTSWIVPTQLSGMPAQAFMNSNFNFWQRNITFTNPASGSYTADRIKLFSAVDSGAFPTTIIHSQQSLTTGDILNSYYFYRIAPNGAGTTSANQNYFICQYIENGTRLLAGLGKKVTLSFWARSSIAGKKLGIALDQLYGSGGSPTGAENINGTNITLTSTWVKYSYTFTTNTLVGKTFGTNNDDALVPEFYIAWGTGFMAKVGSGVAETFVGSGNIDIAQVQLCSGDVPQTYQPKSASDELFSCMRYFEKSYNYADVVGSIASSSTYGFNALNTTPTYSQSFKVKKRNNPTITYYSSATGTSGKARDFSASADITASVGNNGEGLFTTNYGTTTVGNLILGHWTADAEF